MTPFLWLEEGDEMLNRVPMSSSKLHRDSAVIKSVLIAEFWFFTKSKSLPQKRAIYQALLQRLTLMLLKWKEKIRNVKPRRFSWVLTSRCLLIKVKKKNAETKIVKIKKVIDLYQPWKPDQSFLIRNHSKLHNESVCRKPMMLQKRQNIEKM